MKIYSINSRTQFTKPTNFKGLWGKETVDVISAPVYSHAYECDMGTDHTVTTHEYHPFFDETSDEIDKAIASRTSRYPKDDGTYSDYIRESKVKLMPRLAISSADFAAYETMRLLSKAEMFVEDALKLANLQKYLRNWIK